jgi:Mycothiol maleylpyruvate isomerase N-terminal domain
MSSPARPVTELDKSDVLSGLFDTWDSLDRLLTGLSGQQWQTPTPLPGWTVHNFIELTGPLARTIRVLVDGRARVVDDFAGEQPTATIRLDGVLFTRLAGGRADASAGGVELGGDQEVATRIVEHLNYTI